MVDISQIFKDKELFHKIAVENHVEDDNIFHEHEFNEENLAIESLNLLPSNITNLIIDNNTIHVFDYSFFDKIVFSLLGVCMSFILFWLFSILYGKIIDMITRKKFGTDKYLNLIYNNLTTSNKGQRLIYILKVYHIAFLIFILFPIGIYAYFFSFNISEVNQYHNHESQTIGELTIDEDKYMHDIYNYYLFCTNSSIILLCISLGHYLILFILFIYNSSSITLSFSLTVQFLLTIYSLFLAVFFNITRNMLLVFILQESLLFFKTLNFLFISFGITAQKWFFRNQVFQIVGFIFFRLLSYLYYIYFLFTSRGVLWILYSSFSIFFIMLRLSIQLYFDLFEVKYMFDVTFLELDNIKDIKQNLHNNSV
eukprot:TRINITY_DN11741_c0_g1_i1.p1 TRINITY_DN11741_c0_g1~~TRINITY_DN11741_c0_g1_i1.p1  ORF type:complete len:368 (-),score=21.48 TRINITY_DN11741_c0_g1_i1:62-1165(-)